MVAFRIEQIHSIQEHLEELSELLIQVVAEGASIGFVPPLQLADASRYWETVLEPSVILFVAFQDDQIAGTIQLHLSTKPNGNHRAEIAKLMTHPKFRRHGIARKLMQQAEERAKQEERTLIVLDTREGDPSNLLYTSLDYIQAGRIPHFARSANGELHPTILYYKLLN
ncbi:GNAT family N-acetyltransferase [Tumebacillus algifaecis]|uniref:GNAT family N-acetyltransferase n=1 Tax=Tumebacillus algifaecis TaxID=1214604 RepID=A0A223D2N8_9BACL|nr:GNAT family N-acetyltransferase [Tumebacillus algifaecis]ASS75850.1 GNAT family N-acetyltransferase [Tumebacillus algifaecis]